MAANTALRVSELEFNEIRDNLKAFLRSQNEFTDYDFEGSGMAVFLDLLAYNTHYKAYYLNMIANEMFLDSALLRESLVSHAKSLNYTPRSRSSSSATVNIRVTPSNNELSNTTTLTLPRFTDFSGQAIDGTNYNFTTINANTASKVNSSFLFSNVIINQGDVTTSSFLVTTGNPKQRFTIPSANLDTNHLFVSVQESATNTDLQTYTQASDLTILRSNTRSYFVEENPDANGSWTIQFGDGVLGKKLANGNIVTVTYLDTAGKLANKVNSYVLLESINGFNDNVIVTPVTQAAGGADRETNESIRESAPIHYTTQNRIVTVNDYKHILQTDYPFIEAVSVWSGDDNDPPVYGKTFISLKPIDNYSISTKEKEEIIEEIIENRAVLTVTPEIIDPDFTYLVLDVKVYYNPDLTNEDEATLRNLVRTSILNYRSANLTDFDSTFRNSQLLRQIDDSEKSIRSSTIDVFVQKRITPTLASSQNYTVDFKIPLKDVEDLYSAPSIQVKDSAGVTRNCFFEEVPASATGIDSIDVVNPGFGYTSIPTITISGDGTGATATAQIVNGSLNSIVLNSRGANYTQATASITGGGGSGAAAIPILERKNGNLRLFYSKDNGEKVFVSENIGTINYLTGEIVLTNLQVESVTNSPNYNDDVFTINVRPEDLTIRPIRNRILDIDQNDATAIQITMIADTS